MDYFHSFVYFFCFCGKINKKSAIYEVNMRKSQDIKESEEYYKYYENIFRIPDHPFANIDAIEKRYEMENALLRAIETGNEKLAWNILSEAYPSDILAQNRLSDSLRNLKDYLITLNVLCRKTAERAGVHPIYIDSVSNNIVIFIENAKNMEECQKIIEQIISAYCILVRRINHQSYSPIIRKVLAYIDTELCTDLSLSTFAKYLNVNASYLSTLFSKEVGMPLSEYVNQARIFHAKKLLQGTNLPIKFISEQCGFSDTHYFTRVFRKLEGITPNAYRKS
jgi:YesN/AraC family two-component response regulator